MAWTTGLTLVPTMSGDVRALVRRWRASVSVKAGQLDEMGGEVVGFHFATPAEAIDVAIAWCAKHGVALQSPGGHVPPSVYFDEDGEGYAGKIAPEWRAIVAAESARLGWVDTYAEIDAMAVDAASATDTADDNHSAMHTKGSPAYRPIGLEELCRRIADGQTEVYFNSMRVTGIREVPAEPEPTGPVASTPICVLMGPTRPGVRTLTAAEARAEGFDVDDAPPSLVCVVDAPGRTTGRI